MKDRRYIGVDLHTNNFVAYCLSQDRVEVFCETFLLNDKGFSKFLKLLKPSDYLAVEAVSNSPSFIEKVSNYVEKAVTLSPSQFDAIGKSIKKTDKNDAKTIATFLSKDLLPIARVKKELSRRILSLVDTRYLMVKSRSMFINKTLAIVVQNGHKTPRTALKSSNFQKHVYIHKLCELSLVELRYLEAQIHELDTAIRNIEQQIFSKAEMLKHYHTLLSIKGLGCLSAATLAAIVEDVGYFSSSAKLCSYFGIVPKVRISNSINKSSRISKRGTKLGRTTLIQATWVARRYHPFLKDYYERLKHTKGSKRAIVATSRKFLIIMYHAMQKNIVYTDFVHNEYISLDEYLERKNM